MPGSFEHLPHASQSQLPRALNLIFDVIKTSKQLFRKLRSFVGIDRNASSSSLVASLVIESIVGPAAQLGARLCQNAPTTDLRSGF